MKTTQNTDGTVSITLSKEEIAKIRSDWREIERHFDMDAFFGGDANSIQALIEACSSANGRSVP